MENKDMIDMILNEIEEGGVKLLTDDKKRMLMVNSIRKYNQVLEEKVEYLESELNEDAKKPEKPEKVEEEKEDAGKVSYKELAKSRNIRK